jgi:hypothetical protein
MKHIAFTYLFILITILSYGQKRVYPTIITLNNGNVTYCKNTAATSLTISFTTIQCGANGSSSNVSHTEKIYVNTVNSTVGGTEVATLTNALFATNATYTPLTTTSGILYYYATVQWTTDGCATGNILTSSVVAVTVNEPNSSIPFSQGFNGSSCGWTSQQVSGTAGAITNIASATNETTTPYEGAGFIQFNSFSCSAGNSTRLQSPDLTVGVNEDVQIKFQWRNSTTATYSDRLDRVVVQWFNGTTWTDIQTFNRPDVTLNGWQEKTCQFNTGNNTNIRIGFRFISAYGYNSALDNVIVSKVDQTPLPVELLYFETRQYPNFNVLNWSTASESNSLNFVVEHSIDGETWLPIASKPAAGYSVEKITYTYLHVYKEYVVNYYRLMQYDIDGAYEIYGPIASDNRLSQKKIMRYINLMGQEVDVTTPGVVIEVYDDGTMRKVLR